MLVDFHSPIKTVTPIRERNRCVKQSPIQTVTCTMHPYKLHWGKSPKIRYMGRGSSVVLVMGYELDGRFRLSLFHSVQAGCGAHAASYPMGNDGVTFR